MPEYERHVPCPDGFKCLYKGVEGPIERHGEEFDLHSTSFKRQHSLLLQHSLFRFVLVGLSNTLIGMGVIYIAWRFLGLGDLPANMLGYAIGFVWSYALNRLWTFQDSGAMGRSFGRFALVCAVGYLANLLVLFTARRLMGEASFLPHVFGTVAYTVLGYLGSRFFAFRQQANPGG
jgi:putative flippase GtrA